jgi:hypothetical protein
MDEEYCNNSGTDSDLKETIQNKSSVCYQQNFNMQWTMCLLDVACAWRLKETICSTLFKYGE